mmetsp:Transcript_17916/g.49689  ORF Transcript_17916/g.49689 Transcript_17916/m.49689 type:complete len:210 (-) Transcript_17916:36-665(-)
MIVWYHATLPIIIRCIRSHRLFLLAIRAGLIIAIRIRRLRGIIILRLRIAVLPPPPLLVLLVGFAAKDGGECRLCGLRDLAGDAWLCGIFIKFPQQLLLSRRDVRGNLDLEMDDLVALRPAVKLLDALAAHHESGIGLRALGDLHLYLALQRFDVDGATEDGLRDGDRYFDVDVGSVAHEVVIPVHDHLHDEVATRGAWIAFRSLAIEP